MMVFYYTPQGFVDRIWVNLLMTPSAAAEVSSALGADGKQYVVDLRSRTVVIGPRYANYNAWRELRNPEGVLWCYAYKGDDLDRLVMGFT